LSSTVCRICGQGDPESDIYGPQCLSSGIHVHTFCAAFSTGLLQRATIENRTVKFRFEDIINTIVQATQKCCFICSERGASIDCAETSCERSFHLPCALRGECVTQYFGEHRSFCREHRPQQAVEVLPAQDTTCAICMEPVGDSKSFNTMVCPACKHAWFHRVCIQGLALRAGITCFCCPFCRDRGAFLLDMDIMGIRVPARGSTWEDNDAYAALGERHGRCDVSECLCPQGREHVNLGGPWQLFLCSSCAAEGTHWCCSYSSIIGTGTWECSTCAGVGTG
ncbi:PHF7 protein, partial [Penelope pileata]|nr:PHF7 protein [Penelope pileata]